MVMHKNREGAAVFEMLSKALEVARREKRVTEERNIRILIAQMHVVKVIGPSFSSFFFFFLKLGIYFVLKGEGLSNGKQLFYDALHWKAQIHPSRRKPEVQEKRGSF